MFDKNDTLPPFDIPAQQPSRSPEPLPPCTSEDVAFVHVTNYPQSVTIAIVGSGMTHTGSALEYRKAPQAARTRSGPVAAGYFVGLIIGSVGLAVVETMILGTGKSESESAAYLPLFIAIELGVMALSAIWVGGAMWLWGRMTRRAVSGCCWLKSFAVGVVVLVGPDLMAHIPAVQELLGEAQDWVNWAYWVGAFFVLPLAALLLMTRSAQDVSE